MNTDEVYAEFERKYGECSEERKRPTILVAGYTGSGKTSLIQAICGKEVVSSDKIAAGLPQTQAFDFYEDDFIRFFDSKGLEAGTSEDAFVEDTRAFVQELQGDPDVDKHVHLVWYTVQGSGARVTPCDIRLIKSIFPNVIVLITKSDITRSDQREAMTEILVENNVLNDRIPPCSESSSESLSAVVDLSYRLLPEAYRDAFVDAQMVDLEKKATKAKATIQTAAVAAATAGAVPIPLSDAAIITPIQIGMVVSLTGLYKEPQVAMRSAIIPIIAQAIGIQTAAGLTKIIPGLGSTISGGVAYALTTTVGYIVNAHLAKRLKARIAGEAPPDFHFNPKDFMRLYEECTKQRKKGGPKD